MMIQVLNIFIHCCRLKLFTLQGKKQPVWQKYSTYGQVTNRYYSLTIDAKMVASRPRFEQF